MVVSTADQEVGAKNDPQAAAAEKARYTRDKSDRLKQKATAPPRRTDGERRPDPDLEILKAKLHDQAAAAASRPTRHALNSEPVDPPSQPPAPPATAPLAIDQPTSPSAGASEAAPHSASPPETAAATRDTLIDIPMRLRATSADRMVEACAIRWWRGYVKSQFLATSATGEIAHSPYFRWRRPQPPEQQPPATEALRALVLQLQRDGWTETGRGKQWFELRFTRTKDRRRRREMKGSS